VAQKLVTCRAGAQNPPCNTLSTVTLCCRLSDSCCSAAVRVCLRGIPGVVNREGSADRQAIWRRACGSWV